MPNISKNGDSFHLNSTDLKEINQLAKLVAFENGQILKIETIQPNIEEIFLKLIDGNQARANQGVDI